MRVGIALGSNLGDRHVRLQEALVFLRELHETGDFLVSDFHETLPVDCPEDSPDFLNAVVELESSLEPVELLHRLQDLERRSGRPSAHDHHAPRTLDLDLLYCDEMTLHDPELELPHPRMRDRAFVLAPLCQIRPSLRLPGWSMTTSEYLSRIDKNNE